MSTALGHLRVVDISTDLGWVCGRLLAGLGADVIRVETSADHGGVHTPPFTGDDPVSLAREAGNAGKRSLALDLAREEAIAVVRKLVERADVFVESFTPGYLDSLGLGHADLTAVNPRLVYVSITPYGQTGPYSGFRASDLTLQAMGGLAWLCGDPDRAPTRIGAPQAAVLAGAQAATASVLGCMLANVTGEGTHVDVSAQEAVTWGLVPTRQVWELSHLLIMRAGTARSFSDRRIRVIYPCQDGHAAVFGVIGRELPTLIEWLDDAGIEHDLRDDYWKRLSEAGTEAATQPDFDHVADLIAQLSMTYGREELAQEAQRRRIIVYPVYGPLDLLRHGCLHDREHFEHVTLVNGESADIPGAPFRFSKTPWQVAVAPRLGADTRGILEELGYAPAEVARLEDAGVVQWARGTAEVR